MQGAPPAGRELAVEAKGVAVAYERTRDKSTLIALEDFTLDVAEGEFLAIVGPSGCGKSTFLNVVAGLVPAAAGEVKVFGKTVTGPGPDRAVVFQDYALMPWRTVESNVRFGLEMQHRIDSGSADKIAQYYGDPEKRRSDARSLRTSMFAKRVALGEGFPWKAVRWGTYAGALGRHFVKNGAFARTPVSADAPIRVSTATAGKH